MYVYACTKIHVRTYITMQTIEALFYFLLFFFICSYKRNSKTRHFMLFMCDTMLRQMLNRYFIDSCGSSTQIGKTCLCRCLPQNTISTSLLASKAGYSQLGRARTISHQPETNAYNMNLLFVVVRLQFSFFFIFFNFALNQLSKRQCACLSTVTVRLYVSHKCLYVSMLRFNRNPNIMQPHTLAQVTSTPFIINVY